MAELKQSLPKLTSQQFSVLKAAVSRIIPADDYPCGWDAGVGDFFALLLAREPRFAPAYQTGLDALDAEAQAAAQTPFAALPPDRQDALLRDVEAGRVRADWPQDPAAFFHLLVEQTMEGFYADPGNGGNKNSIAWDMIGYQVTA